MEDRSPAATGAPPTGAPAGRSVEDFLGEPTRRFEDWRWLFEQDESFPIRSHRGLFGSLVVAWKRMLRPLVVTPQRDLWERQRIFNLIALEHLERQAQRLDHREALLEKGLAEIMRHTDALYSRVDQKLDALRRESSDHSARLRAALALVEAGEVDAAGALRRAEDETDYRQLEERYRGSREVIEARVRTHLDRLAGCTRVLDLGCGRGEALAVLAAAGKDALGVDSSEEMVRACRAEGLEAEVSDLFEYLSGQEAESFDAVVSFHVIEHLPTDRLDGLLRLAWRVLRPGGVLLLETPSPLSLVAGARNFWLDPTHIRPVHPQWLAFAYERAGFDDIERIDCNPFADGDRLPELGRREDGELDEHSQRILDRLGRLRDRLDDLLFGAQDYALFGRRGGSSSGSP